MHSLPSRKGFCSPLPVSQQISFSTNSHENEEDGDASSQDEVFFFFFLETARVTGFIGQRERTGTGTQRDKCLERETFVYPGGELGTVRDRWRPGSIIRGVAVVVNT